MRVGVYVDGYNLYYGARAVCGRSKPGWRWLDVRGLVKSIISAQGAWASAAVTKVVYCTARVDAKTNASAHADQDVYLKALRATGSVDWIEYGNYVVRTKVGLLATEHPKTGRPVPYRSAWPVVVRDRSGAPVHDAQFMVKYMHFEEKGSDVNVASHLLVDVLGGVVDAAVVVSNDSDLALPMRVARDRVPVGTVNPRQGFTAGDLTGKPTDGAGNHWWWKVPKAAYLTNQLPSSVGRLSKPPDW